MQKMKNYRNAVIFVLMALTFASCFKQTDPKFEITGDIFVTKKLVNDVVQYAPSYFVYGTAGMTSATVTLPNGGATLNLDGTYGGITYSKEATISDFSENTPEEGSYLFEAVSTRNETLQTSDQFQLGNLDIPVIDSVKFMSDGILRIGWNKATGADGYYIRILDAEGNIIFISYGVNNQTTYYDIDESGNTGKWEQNVSSGETCTAELNAFSYDSDATQSNGGYNIQEVAVRQTQLTWQ